MMLEIPDGIDLQPDGDTTRLPWTPEELLYVVAVTHFIFLATHRVITEGVQRRTTPKGAGGATQGDRKDGAPKIFCRIAECKVCKKQRNYKEP